MSAIEFRRIRKQFDNVAALDEVSFSLAGAGVHGLLGENGAGKTTIMNILYGLLRPDGGEILLGGQPADFRSPRDAIDAGVGMVHQHFMLAGAMTVLDNVLLGDRRQGRVLNRKAAAAKLEELAGRLNLHVDPAARIDELSVGQQQRVEILKALYRDINVLILDEPTAVLTPLETDELLAAMSRLRDEGKSVIFISHKLGEVLRICDDITILRRGRLAWQGRTADATPADLAREMVGQDIPEPSPHSIKYQISNIKYPLVLDHVSAPGLTDITFTLGSEILGIAGVDGNGQQELAETVVGLRAATAGRILLDNVDVTQLVFFSRTRLGIAHIPNDRKREGLVGSMSIAENIALKHHRQLPFSRRGVMSWRNTRELAASLVSRFDVRCASLDMPVASLSGGNQQKLVLARELAVVEPKLIVAMNPTRGLDIAATHFVHEQLRLAGCAVLLISSELEELMRLSNRIAVLYRGRLTMTNFPNTDTAEIGQFMAGIA
jgi:simple sugar transport system ATP-binding protein